MQLNEELKQQHVTAFSAAEAAHSEAKEAWDAERTEIMQECDTFRTKLHESEELVNNLTSQLADVKVCSSPLTLGVGYVSCRPVEWWPGAHGAPDKTCSFQQNKIRPLQSTSL